MAFREVAKIEDLAYNVKYFGQITIGVVVFIVLCKHSVSEFLEIFTSAHCNIINLKHSLEVVSYGLGISAGIEMAYMLFTPGPDEAVEPVILGLSSTLLFILSSLDFEKTNFVHFSILILSIGALIGGLFYIKDRFI